MRTGCWPHPEGKEKKFFPGTEEPREAQEPAQVGAEGPAHTGSVPAQSPDESEFILPAITE